MIPVAKPLIGEEEFSAVDKVLRSGVIAQGAKVSEFEENFADYIGVDYAVATSNGTTALHIALLAHGIDSGEVITTPFTFIATANSILHAGAKPIFADIGPDFNIVPENIEERITKNTRAILPVHLYGQPADMDAILKIAEDHDLVIIEDAAQAHGAKYKGQKVGSFGTGAFSFYPTKNMTTGEGGIITTNDGNVAKKAKMIREHGSSRRYFHEILGFNFRMTDINAAMGVEQLKKLDRFNHARRENAGYLTKKLGDLGGIILPQIYMDRKHVFHQYTIRITEEFEIPRNEVIKKLNENGVGTGIYYPLPIHKQPFYMDLGYNESLPISESMANEVISLPIHPQVTRSDLDHVAETLSIPFSL